MTLKFYKYACTTPHLHKISNLTVLTGQFTFDYKVLKRYMIRKIVKQGTVWFSNMQIRYFKDLSEPCLNTPQYLEVSAVATPLILAPARDTAPNGILTGKPIKVLRVATPNIPAAMLRPLEQVFSHTNQSNILEYLEYFFAYLSPSLSNPCCLLWIMFKW